MDDIDLKILGLLSNDSKQKYSDLAEILNLSAPSVHARVKKLEQSGVIKSYGVNVDPGQLGLKLCAFVRITLEGVMCSDLDGEFERMPEVEELHSVAGEECLLAKVRTTDSDALSALLDRIRKIKGVRKTITSVVLTTRIDRGPNPSAVNENNGEHKQPHSRLANLFANG
jgi:Lrp/AsnC family leucine-responsive transcriptional regulator